MIIKIGSASVRAVRAVAKADAKSSPSFSIITPSACFADSSCPCGESILQQEGISAEHVHAYPPHPQSSGPANSPANSLVETIHHRIERAIAQASGDIVCVLGCNERLLPGALQFATAFFRSHPNVDVMFAGTLRIDSNGNRLSLRGPVLGYRQPDWMESMSAIPCIAFAQRRAFISLPLLFAPMQQKIGTIAWILDTLDKIEVVGALPRHLSIITSPESTTDVQAVIRRRSKHLYRQARESGLTQRTADWHKAIKTSIRVHRRLEKLINLHFGRRTGSRVDISSPKSVQDNAELMSSNGAIRFDLFQHRLPIR
jgi:hypothetical protein